MELEQLEYRGTRRGHTEFESVDCFWSDVGGIGLASKFGCERHCADFARLTRRRGRRDTEVICIQYEAKSISHSFANVG